MKRKIMVVFLTAVMSLLVAIPILAQGYSTLQEYEKATGKKIEKFNEAPMLRTKVAAGELPAVEKRIPNEPLVVEPVEEIGQYGGTWRAAFTSGKPYNPLPYDLWECPVRWNKDYTKLLPNVVKGWKFSEDAKSVTFFLRKGMKWSDGVPFTADDWLFWYEDIILNDELTPIKPSFLVIGGEIGKMEKIDDWTVKLSFTKPYGMILEYLQTEEAYAPKHYLKKFHPNYTSMDKIEKEMKKEGFTLWIDLFGDKNEMWDNPERPLIEGWVSLDSYDSPMQRLVRNPYYWKIDTEGNQLPYIDKIQRTVMPVEAMVLKAVAGEIDFQNRHISSLLNYSLFMQNREKGDYRLVFGTPPGLNFATIYLNFFHKDPVLQKIFRDKRFRKALSMAINRDEINNMFFKGLGIPSQQAPNPADPWYEEKFGKAYTEYDPDSANKILDEIGLKWDKNHEYRLRPDGKELKSVMIQLHGEAEEVPYIEIQELVKKYWKKIGFEIVVKPTNVSLWVTRLRASDFDIAGYAGNSGSAGYPPVKSVFVFPFSNYCYWGTKWGLWFSTNGKSGKEPPEDAKRLMEIYDEIRSEVSMEKKTALYKEAFTIHMENLWLIGLINRAPQQYFYVVTNHFRNVPNHLQMESGSCSRSAYYSAQYFIKK